MTPNFSPINLPNRLQANAADSARQTQDLSVAMSRHFERMGRTYGARINELWVEAGKAGRGISDAATRGQLNQEAQSYLADANQRLVLTVDTLRQRGNADIAHMEAGTPPVLIYDTEMIVDGHNMARPVNYMLLKILPPEGVTVHDWKRPYMIIDPRAGHGAGIGGFKQDSQVGVALRDGHPVYFVVFRPHPEPGQVLADVMRAEAEFINEIVRRHPEAPKPIIVGNCQGGWATMVLAAANPDITGPLVINGAPLAYWSGRLGENPMRYNGGLLGGVLPALLLADLGHGEFDGAHLVSNFEMLNPGRNFFGKYYDLYRDVDGGRERFLEFERWWGGFHFMNEAEIRWIVEQLFVGNRLSRGEGRIERGRHLDLKAIRSPIIVFASHGDNITPPQQALNWIVDTYADEHEIKIRGQRIIYMVHDKVGHLGIFVSSSIAKKEHTEVASTMKTIEALAPGLYEMVIEKQTGEGLDAHFEVSFHERKLDDILKITDADRTEEHDFAAVARLSELGAEIYELGMRPLIQSMITPQTAQLLQSLHPSRVQRLGLSDQNPVMASIKAAAESVEQRRQSAAADNPFVALEKVWAGCIEMSFDMMRDMRDMMYETSFLSIYGSPFMHWIGESHAFKRTKKDPKELRLLPEVRAILMGVDRGGFEEAVIRMLILLADTRGNIRRDRLERSAKVLTKDEPFAALGSERRAALIHEQSIIAEFERDAAINSLADLVKGQEDRKKAIDVVEFIVGSAEDMEPTTLQMLQRFRAVLALPPIAIEHHDVDPLQAPAAAAELPPKLDAAE